MLYKTIDFKKHSDGRGDLVPLEIGAEYNGADIPFDVKRCYFISVPTNDNNAIRGRHAHYDLEQVIICMNGSFILDLSDGKGNQKSIKLDRNDVGIYIKDLVWRELKSFSEDCSILVLASQHYNAKDYIHTYSDFLKEVNK